MPHDRQSQPQPQPRGQSHRRDRGHGRDRGQHRGETPSTTAGEAVGLGATIADRVASLALEADRLTTALRAGCHPAAGAGGSNDFHEYRPWSPGDDIRSIDWRLYGRSNRLYSRQTTHLGAMHLDLRLDASASMAFAGLQETTGASSRARSSSQPGTVAGRESSNSSQHEPTKWEQSLTMAAALAHLAIRQGDRCSLTIAGGSAKASHDLPLAGQPADQPATGESTVHIAPGTGRLHLHRMLTTLALQTPGGTATWAGLTRPAVAPQPYRDGQSGGSGESGAGVSYLRSPGPTTPLPPPSRTPRERRLTLIISDCLEPAATIAWHLQTMHAGRRGRASRSISPGTAATAVVRILSPSERQIQTSTPTERLAFVDPEAGHGQDPPFPQIRETASADRPGRTSPADPTSEHVMTTADAYNRMMDLHSAALRDGLAALGIGFIDVTTALPTIDALGHILNLLRQRPKHARGQQH